MKKTIQLALAVASAVLLALPAVAPAGNWHAEPITKFAGTGGASELTTTSGSRVQCATVVFTGEYQSTTAGTLELSFHGCKGPLGVSCQSVGASPETIITTELSFNNVHLEPNRTKPGVLIQPPVFENHFATFTCAGVTTIVQGGGLFGEVTFPECGKTTSTASLSFARRTDAGGKPIPGHQKWTQITTDELYAFDFTAKVGAAAASLASIDASGTVAFGQPVKVDCTHP